jgi:hypothetical protein
MKFFLTKLLIFGLLIILIGVALTPFLPVDKYWGNREYAWKIKEYKKGTYNTVLFGTSRIYRGIDPLAFDSLINDKHQHKLKSYNLATHASWFNETMYLYEEFLKDSALSSGVEVAFMEFQNIMAIRPEKLTSEKAIYYQNAEHYIFMLKYCKYEILRDPKKIFTSVYQGAAYSLASFINLTNLKRISTKISTKDLQEVENINSRGFLEFPESNEHTSDARLSVVKSFADNVNNYLGSRNRQYNGVYFDRVVNLIRKSKAKGIKLVFVLPPVRLTEGMIAVYNALPKEHRIQVCDPKNYPELYDPKNWIDTNHLNKFGAQKLTNRLAESVIKLNTTKL